MRKIVIEDCDTVGTTFVDKRGRGVSAREQGTCYEERRE